MREDKACVRSWLGLVRRIVLAAGVVAALTTASVAQRIEAGQPGTGQQWSAQTLGPTQPAAVRFATRAGQVELFAGQQNGVEFRVGGRAYPLPGHLDELNYRSPVFQIGADDVFAIVTQCAGSACSFAGVVFVRLRANVPPAFSNQETLEGPAWGRVSADGNYDRIFRQAGATIVVDYGANGGGAGDLVYTNADGTVRAVAARAPAAPPAAARPGAPAK
jgi:hypothetical protein